MASRAQKKAAELAKKPEETEEEKSKREPWHPESVQARFDDSHKRGSSEIFLAAAFRKVAQEMNTGVSPQRALEIVAQEIEEGYEPPEEDAPKA